MLFARGPFQTIVRLAQAGGGRRLREGVRDFPDEYSRIILVPTVNNGRQKRAGINRNYYIN